MKQQEKIKASKKQIEEITHVANVYLHSGITPRVIWTPGALLFVADANIQRGRE